MKLKRNVIACVGCVMVLLLGVAMVCGGCKKDKQPEWTYNGATTAGTEENTEGTKKPTPAGPDEPAPSVNIEIVDREDLGDTTAPTTDQGGSDIGGNIGIEDRPVNPTDPATPTTPAPTTPAPTTPTPTTPTPGPAGPELDADGYWTYEYYDSRTGDEQFAYMKTFPSVRAFNDWYNAAKAAYDAAQPRETIGSDGVIELD